MKTILILAVMLLAHGVGNVRADDAPATSPAVATNTPLLGTWCAVIPQGKDDTLTAFEFFADGTAQMSWTWLTRPPSASNVTAALPTYGFTVPYAVTNNWVVVGPSAFVFTIQDNHLIASNEVERIVFTKVGRSTTPLNERPRHEDHTVKIGDVINQYQLIFQAMKERHWPTMKSTLSPEGAPSAPSGER